ncbi:MAG: rhomboid family intramembrane serine protease [Planctomycetota bacterium]
MTDTTTALPATAPVAPATPATPAAPADVLKPPVVTWLLLAGMIALALATTDEVVDETAVCGGALWAGEWWRLLNACVVHLGVTHIALNSLALYFLGTRLEPALGPIRMLVIFVVCGVAGSATGATFHDALMVGASGALFGMLAVYLVCARLVEGSWRKLLAQPAMQVILALAIGVNVLAFWMPIGVGGHVGGFVAGLVYAWARIVAYRRPRVRRIRTAIGVAGLALIVAVSMIRFPGEQSAAWASVLVQRVQREATHTHNHESVAGAAAMLAKLDEAAQFAPPSARVEAFRAELLIRLGRFADARDAAQRALEATPGLVEALEALAKAQRGLHDEPGMVATLTELARLGNQTDWRHAWNLAATLQRRLAAYADDDEWPVSELQALREAWRIAAVHAATPADERDRAYRAVKQLDEVIADLNSRLH